MREAELDFFVGRDAVGCFVGTDYPGTPGRVEYEPYRGAGHARLVAALRQGKSVRCWFSRAGRRVLLTITGEEFVPGPWAGPSQWYVQISRLDGC